MTDESDLSADLRARLDALTRESIPPAALEERTVGALRAHRLLARPARRPLRFLVLAAAAALLFVTGFELGRRSASSSAMAAEEPLAPSEFHSPRVVAWF